MLHEQNQDLTWNNFEELQRFTPFENTQQETLNHEKRL